MKKVLLTAFAVMASLSLFAQGTITFANNSSTKVMFDDGSGGAPVVAGNPYVVGLYYGAAGTPESQLTMLAGSQKNLTSGLFFGGTQTLTGIAGGGVAQVQVRGWDGTAGSYDAAIIAGKGVGKSLVLTMGTGNPPLLPAQALTANGLNSFVIAVPEPSTIALGLLGLAGLFVLRRRS